MSLKKLRKSRIKINEDLDIAAFDTIGTGLIGYLIARKTGYSAFIIIPGIFVLAEGIHAGFGIDTPGLRYLNENMALK